MPLAGRGSYHEPNDPAVTARTIAAQLGHMIDRADQAGMAELGEMLDRVRLRAEQLSRG